MNVACSVLWGGSRSTKTCVFPCKVATSCMCAAVAAGVVWFLLCVLKRVLVPVCVGSSMRFLNPCLQIALEWLRQGCLLPRLHA